MSDSILHERMRQGITCVCVFFGFVLFFCFFFVRGGTSCFPQDERDGISFITITSVGVGKFQAKTDFGRWD